MLSLDFASFYCKRSVNWFILVSWLSTTCAVFVQVEGLFWKLEFLTTATVGLAAVVCIRVLAIIVVDKCLGYVYLIWLIKVWNNDVSLALTFVFKRALQTIFVNEWVSILAGVSTFQFVGSWNTTTCLILLGREQIVINTPTSCLLFGLQFEENICLGDLTIDYLHLFSGVQILFFFFNSSGHTFLLNLNCFRNNSLL